MSNQEVIVLRNRILGVLIQNARDRARISQHECAAVLSISLARYTDYEEGTKTISLPELELLARFIETPMSAFRTTASLADATKEVKLPNPEMFLPLRNRIVGAKLRQARLKAGQTQQDLADLLGCSASTISDYEHGRRSASVAELELIGRELTLPIDYFMDRESDVGVWHQLQQQFELFTELPAPMREFVLRPINRSYLELAMKLAQMPAGALRAIAEGLLEITY